MADVDLQYLVQWEDRFMGIISARDIVSPMKTYYQEGEIVQAKYKKKTFKAAICEIHPNRKYLHQQSKLPPKHPYDIAHKKYLDQLQQQKLPPLVDYGNRQAAVNAADGQSSAVEQPKSKPLRPADQLQRPADWHPPVDLQAKEQTTDGQSSAKKQSLSKSLLPADKLQRQEDRHPAVDLRAKEQTTTDDQSSAEEKPPKNPLQPTDQLQRPAFRHPAVNLLAQKQTTSAAFLSSAGTSHTECINLMEHSEDSDECMETRHESDATGPTREEFNQLMDDVRSLRRRVRKLESEKGGPKLNANYEESLFSVIESCDSEFEAVEKLMLRLFDIETIISSSVSGKRANSKVQNAKKPLDYVKILSMKDVMKRKFPNLKKSDLTARIHSVQKKLRRQKQKI